MDYLKDLNPQQREAAGLADGASLIIAGPGTGKTRTLIARIAYLVKVKAVEPGNILALTFTKSAAKEMRERLDLTLGAQAADLWVETFHAAALKILKEENYPFPQGREWSLAGDEEKEALVSGRFKPSEQKAFFNELRLRKQRLLPLESPEAQKYQERLLALGRLDYDDLLYYVWRLFEENPQALARWRARFHHILVDEFQDTAFAQYSILKQLAPANICAIGDPDQAIYGFALSGFSAFESFRKDFPAHRLFPLTQNYRSQGGIVEAAAQIIGRNVSDWRQELRAALERGLPIEISAHLSEAQEAEMMVRKIEAILGGSSGFTQNSGWAGRDGESGRYGFADIAVLYRFHAQARRIEEALERAGLPYRIWGRSETQEDLQDFQNGRGVEGEGITLMSLHRSKGLEFPVVFIPGCEAGILPSQLGNPAPALDEERRLFYVGLTRAKNRAFLSYARKRTLFGKALPGGPSPFLADIQEELRRLEEFKAPERRKPADPTPLLF